jgi:hypothetical protein
VLHYPIAISAFPGSAKADMRASIYQSD